MITEALFVIVKHWNNFGGPSAGKRVTDWYPHTVESLLGEKGALHEQASVDESLCVSRRVEEA